MQLASNLDKQLGVVAKKQPRTKKIKKWVKPKGMPKRPLSAYNFFFAKERQNLLDRLEMNEENPVTSDGAPRKVKIGFANLARTVASKWKTLSDEEKQPFVDQAEVEQERYKVQVQIWQDLGLDPRRENKKPQENDSTGRSLKGSNHEPSGSIPGVAAACMPTNDRTSFSDTNSACGLWTPTSLALHKVHSCQEDVPSFCQSSTVAGNSSVGSSFSWEPLPLKRNNDLPATEMFDWSTTNKLLLEPLPIEQLAPWKRHVNIDNQQLTAKLSKELRGKLDNDEVGFLRSAFARSA